MFYCFFRFLTFKSIIFDKLRFIILHIIQRITQKCAGMWNGFVNAKIFKQKVIELPIFSSNY